MVMEAIWLSIQETDMQRSSGSGEMAPCSQYVSEEEPAMPSSSSSCAISALAERQQMVGESSNHNHNVNVSSYTMLPGNCDSYYGIEQEVDDIDHHHNHYHNNSEMEETGSNAMKART
ncbi:E3 ubiquitin-protein ligase DA2-like [Brassica napus]|uniref:E3 ubiquitin-protein ligase DA2-like n=1 Tax=Brassica napus TaxID=3708 RepID=UPI0006AB4AC6|nr:E3 ubiquitin-protein ligase DA2-like [Brassica napus]